MTEYNHYGVYALIRKTRGPHTGLLDLPGGSPEFAEMPRQTLIREVKEETGADVCACEDVGQFETAFSFEEEGEKSILRHEGCVFLTSVKNNICFDAVSADTSGCCWMPRENCTLDTVTPPVLFALQAYF